MIPTFGKALRVLCMSLLAVHLLLATTAAEESAYSLPASLAEAASDRLAPDFALKDLEGNVVRLSRFNGKKAVLLYFWATWCPHCVASRPDIAAIREKVPESDLQILGINVGAGDSLQKVQRFQKGHPTSWPILYDADQQVAQSFGVQGIPLYVLVNKKGEIVYRSYELPDPGKYLP